MLNTEIPKERKARITEVGKTLDYLQFAAKFEGAATGTIFGHEIKVERFGSGFKYSLDGKPGSIATICIDAAA